MIAPARTGNWFASSSKRPACPVAQEIAMADIEPVSSATRILGAFRTGGISAVELTEQYIRRIERHDAKLNSVVVRDFDRARQQARAGGPARTRSGAAAP